MNKKFHIRRLSNQLFLAAFIAFLLAFLTYKIVNSFGNEWLDQTIYSETFLQELRDTQFERLKDYIEEEQVTASNLEPLDRWFDYGQLGSLTLYLNDDLIYDTFLTSYGSAQEYALMEVFPSNMADARTLSLSDGEVTTAFFYYYPSINYYYIVVAASYLSAFIVFFICFTYLIHKKLNYIKQLKEELDILALGDLNYHVTVKGNDELSELATGINYMRESILERQTGEEQLRNASLELVTAMSHDLRTPLTSLLAYLEMIQRGKYENDEQLHHFVERSLDKALQIKSMSDKLFEYFFVYSKEWEDIVTETVDADEFLQNYWGEYAFALENKGFCVNVSFSQLQGKLSVNTELIQRAFDNLYSNLLKYADPSLPVELRYEKADNTVKLSVKNAIRKDQSEKESTNIGLNTCKRILIQHNGTFETLRDGNFFCVTLTLPLS